MDLERRRNHGHGRLGGEGLSDIVQRYRFRVRTADGRELVSQVATVTRPAPATSPAPETPPANVLPDPTPKGLPPEEQPAAVAMFDVPVHQILVAVKGAKQGDFKVDPGFKDTPGKAPHHQFATVEFQYAITSPRDPQSGLPTGQRMHHPVMITREIGPGTPQFYAALAMNETLPEVILDCYGKDAAGQLRLAHSVKLTNASVASIDFQKPNVRDPAQQKYAEYEQVGLTFEKVELTHGEVVAEDEWSARV